jgi:hypothetical protein
VGIIFYETSREKFVVRWVTVSVGVNTCTECEMGVNKFGGRYMYCVVKLLTVSLGVNMCNVL